MFNREMSSKTNWNQHSDSAISSLMACGLVSILFALTMCSSQILAGPPDTDGTRKEKATDAVAGNDLSGGEAAETNSLAQPTRARLAFDLKSPFGKAVQVAEGSDSLTAVIFLGTQCPMARAYASKLNELQQEYASKLRLIGVMSNQQDSIEDVRNYVQSLDTQFEIVMDPDNIVADRFGATRTPEVFLLDKDLKLRYHGRIDDQYAPSVARGKADREDLRIAVAELLEGKPVSIKETTALGCLIGKVKKITESREGDIVTFADIQPVLKRNCVECHRAGEIGPFTMDRYEEIVGWADTMLETIEDGRMPPWNADPNVGSFANARHMTERDKDLFRQWIQDGYAPGTPQDSSAGYDLGSSATTEEYSSDEDGPSYAWQFDGKPDLVLAMRDHPYVVPKGGIVEYQYFVVDPGFEEDKWIQNAQIIPGSRDVVHHCILFVRPPDGTRFQGVGWLTGYVPGQRAFKLPAGRARKVPAGSKLVFQMHYTPNGTRREDITRVGLQFADPQEVTHEVYSVVALNQDFEIPPETESYPVTAQVRQLPKHGELLAITPHMHYRGKSFTVFAEMLTQASSKSPGESKTPGELSAAVSDLAAERISLPARTTPLLHVPDYDFNWQHTYALAEPMSLEHMERIRFEATFDNSKNNPFNPDASEWVTWGDQTWEEMAVSFFEVSIPRPEILQGAANKRRESADRGSRSSGKEPTVSADLQERRNAYVSRVFEFDSNEDGVIQKSEGSIFLRHFSFGSFDKDGDGKVTKAEVQDVAERLYR